MPLVFAVSLFVSALLLFLVQPMIGKVILPRFGGSPAVWSTSMLFFQAALLAGYSYAHFAPKWLGARRHTIVHVLLLLSPLVVLPLGWAIWPFTAAPMGIAINWAPPGDAHPVPYLLLLLTVLIGLPFFVLSTSAPLLQKWFAGTGQPSGKDPYYLYAASNLGSMIGLLGYPFLVEPKMGLRMQGWVWLAGYAVCAAMILGCMWLARVGHPVATPEPEPKPPADEPGPQAAVETAIQEAPNDGITESPPAQASEHPPAESAPADELDAITPQQIFMWVARAFVPSSMMIGATTYFTTDITPMPLLWVMPLAVYLLSFIIVFFRLPIPGFDGFMSVLHKLFVMWMPLPLLFLVMLLQMDWLRGVFPQLPLFGFHLLALFAVAVACHGELAQTRPAAKHLTAFFLWISVGGVLGGVFNALMAPMMFNRIAEYPLVIAMAGMLLPDLAKKKETRWRLVPTIAMVCLVFGTVAALLSLRAYNDSLNLDKLFEQLPAGDMVWIAVLSGVCLIGAVVALVCYGAELFSGGQSGAGGMVSLARQIGTVSLAVDFAVPVGVGICTALLLSPEPLGTNTLYILLVADAVAVATLIGLIVMQTYRGEPWAAATLVWALFLSLAQGMFIVYRIGPPYSPFAQADAYGEKAMRINEFIMYGMPILLVAMSTDRPLRFGLSLGAVLLVGSIYEDVERFTSGTLLLRERSFFGQMEVQEIGDYHRFLHGTTLHGAQRMDEEHRRTPISYYWRTSPMGEVQSFFDERIARGEKPPPMAVLGLGTGTMAGYTRPGQELWYFEIDPAVIPVARNSKFFTYISDAEERGGIIKIILGDGRLQIKNAPDNHFGLLLLDAFSSDMIPTHLITREAMEMYLTKMAPGGIIGVHISNRYLDLQPMVGNLAKELGLAAIRRYDESHVPGTNSSDWVLVARKMEDFGPLLATGEWAPPTTDPKVAIWTDDFSNLLDVYRWPKKWWKNE